MKAALFPCTALFAFACVTAQAQDPLKAERPSAPDTAKSLWTKRLPGYISDVAVARNGSAILISTIPNYDREGGSHKNQFALYTRAGKLAWSHDMSTALKAEALSNDGSEAIAVTHDNEVIAFNRKGKKLWTQDGNCQPMFLAGGNAILCYHDDDPAPSVAYDVFNAKTGKKEGSFPIMRDILVLRLSSDQKNLALGLTGGEVISVGPGDHPRWRAKVPGEVVDIDISSGKEGWVAVLYRKKKLAAAIFDQAGKKVSELQLPPGSDQIRFYRRSKSVALYGNGEKGQVFSWASEEGKELWKRGASFSAHYSPTQVFSYRAGGESRLLAPYEDVTQGKTYILSFSRTGKLALELPIAVAEGAFLYLEDFSSESGLLATANDDGTLAVFQVTSPQEPSDGP